MNNYELEDSVLCCLLTKPELMEKLRVDDKHFVKRQRIWQFMKSFYKKFKTFDLILMYSVCKNQYHLMNYIEMIMDTLPDIWNFNKYQDELIKQYNENQKEKWIKQHIFVLSNDLMTGNVELKDYQDKVREIYESADKID